MFDVIIDKGHYPVECGAVNGTYKEMDMTNIIGDKVISILKNEYKLSVGCSTGTLQQRAQYENTKGCKAFVSIHINAGGGTGFESWIYSTNSECEKLAKAINSKYENATNMKNRGVKVQPDFYVLKNTKAPAVLFECGFIDTSTDLNYIVNNYDTISRAIAQGIASYLNVSVNSSTSNTQSITIDKNVSQLVINFK